MRSTRSSRVRIYKRRRKMGTKDAILKCVGLRRMILMAMALALIFGMMVSFLAEPVAAQRPSCDTSGTTVQFLGETCLNSTCTWEYEVCQTGFALSHWVLGLCPCLESHITEVGYIDAQSNKTVMPPCPGEPGEPCWEFGLDPTTGLFGLKWDNLPGPENECWLFYLTVDQDLAQEEVNWTSKFAACDPGGGTVTGPACPCGCGEIIAFKYYDVNQNGVYDYERNGEDNPIGDYQLEGWEICLCDGNDVNCQLTDEMGFVDFGCLSPGAYTVCETPQGGWVNSQPDGEPPCYTVMLHAGEQVRLHFGNYEDDPPLAYIRAGKYYDYNHNGKCDGPCCPLNDWEICLYDGNDYDCKTTHDYCMLCGGCTDYWEVEPGTYMLCETSEDGWVNTDPGIDPPCKVVTVEPDEFLCVPFGNWEPPVDGNNGGHNGTTVGGIIMPVNKAELVTPWIWLVVLIVGVGIGGGLMMRRRTTR